MGNEMGNRNVSGLQEEDNTTVEAPEKSLREAVEANDLKGENQIVPAGEGKDYHEKVAGLASDDPLGAGDHPHVDNQTSDEKEKDETEIKVPADGSPEVRVESNNVDGDGSEIQPASSPENVSDHEKPVGSNLEENLLEKNDYQIQRQTSVKRETATEEEETRNSTFDTKSATHDPEPVELVDPKSDQDELAKNHTDPSVEDHSGSLQESEEILGSNITCDSEEKDHLLDTEITQNLAESIVFYANPEAEKRRGGDFLVKEMESQEEKMFDRSFCEEKFEITDGDDHEVGNVMSKLTTNTSDFSSESENKCDGEFLTEIIINMNDFLDSQSEAILQANSVNFYEEVVPEPKDKCMVLTEETKLVESESEVNKHEHNPTQFCEESVKESKIDKVNADQSEFMMNGFRHENEGKESPVESLCNSEINEAEKVAENGYKVYMCHNNTNLDSEEECKDLVEGTEIVSENGKVPMELTASDCNNEGEEPIEKKIIEEIKEKKEDAFEMGDYDAGREVAEQFLSQSPPIEHAQVVLSPSLVSPVQSQDHKQDTVIGSETIEDRSISIADLKQGSSSEFFVTKVSNTDSTKTTVETVVSAVELESEKPQQDPSEYVEKTPRAAAETEVSENQSNALCEEGEKSVFASGDFEAQESMGRLSTESNPENLNSPIQIQKSPSFNFDLLIEARTEESDQTPLLYKDKTATGSLSSRVGVNARSPVAETEYSPEPLQYQTMSEEEKSNKLERSDSKKLRTPFLSLMKEDEEAHIVVTPQKKDSLGAAIKAPEELWNSPATELGSTSPKRKEKRKPRSSLFSSCLCCAAMIN